MNEKEKLEKTFEKVKKLLNNGDDSMIVTFNDDICGGYINGDASHVAQSIFALIHNGDSKIGADMYKILKLVVLNIVANESPFAVDLINSIINVSKGVREEENDEKAMLVGLNTVKHGQGN